MAHMQAVAAGPETAKEAERRTLALACGAHVVHDGYTDLLLVLLPVWQSEFGLGYGEIGMLRALYAGSMAGFQAPSGMLADRFGGRTLLALGTLIAGLGYLLAGIGTGFPMLGLALIIGGIGSSVQHPIASSLVAQTFEGKRSRGALARYNFSGDLGKMAFPAATAWLIAVMPWRPAMLVLATVGVLAAAVIFLLASGLAS